MNTSIGYSNLPPEHKLLHALIKSAILEYDIEYFTSSTFEDHCELLGMQVDLLRGEIFKQIGVNK